jgi:phosphoribosylglycinamide formyltransferase-1
MFKVCVMASGGGGNLKSILESSYQGKIFMVNAVVVDRECGAINVASNFGVKCISLSGTDASAYLEAIPEDTDLLVLAGFMPIVPKDVCLAFENRFINTHPSLLPKHGGIGMYGVRVQEAVLSAGESVAGCTVHRVESEVDSGEILAQISIPIPSGVDAWALGGLVFELETKLLPEVVVKFARGEFQTC